VRTSSPALWGIRYVDAPICRDEDADNDDDCTEAWPTDEHLYYTQDANFNVTGLVRSDTGRVAERYEYDPYGEVTVLDGDPGTGPSPGDADGTGVTEWDPDSERLGQRTPLRRLPPRPGNRLLPRSASVLPSDARAVARAGPGRICRRNEFV
jgi:hypothetical protein